ncbi:universal stress protein [Oceanidesulfovibrio indonesiensis]|uniref:Universal stress protein n=1 Tax=Oceanidesulfovibrio indonesiensis TaxID=54767 RepID=A0A7M3MAN2_9BACT|nr:universal stress protein [Oceanidesulfovibrio indonesiensis]TVM14857.1 universal stress protein [Oceanidesulfovibrio indonesiensis]
MSDIRIKTILLPIDLSPAAPHVAARALYLAEALDARIIPLYVAPSYERYHILQVDEIETNRFAQSVTEGAQRTMAEFVDAHLKSDRVEPGRVVGGYPAETILDIAWQEKADLIVMGTHGHTGIQRLLLGSVAEKVVRSSPVPVFTVRPVDNA